MSRLFRRLGKATHIILTVALVLAIAIVLTLEAALLFRFDTLEDAGYGLGLLFAYSHLFVLYPTIILGFIGTGAYYFSQNQNPFYKLRWDVTLLLFYLLFLLFAREANAHFAINDTVTVQVVNESETPLRYIHVHGRRDHVIIDSLAVGSQYSTTYRGQSIDHRTRNRFENRIYVEYSDQGDRKRKVVVGAYQAISDTICLKFATRDSINVSCR